MKHQYHTSLRILHLLMAVIILGLIGLGWFMAGLDKSVINKSAYSAVHKSFGVLVLFLVALRIAVRLSTKVPPLPDTIPVLVRKLARIGQFMIYCFMIAVPLSGYAMSNFFGRNIDFFGIMQMPKIFPDNSEIGKLVHDYHGVLAYSLLALVLLHISGALKHRFFDKNPKNDVLNSML